MRFKPQKNLSRFILGLILSLLFLPLTGFAQAKTTVQIKNNASAKTSSSTQIQTQVAPSNFEWDWRARLRGVDGKDEQHTYQVFSLDLDFKAEYKLLRNLKLDMIPSVRLHSGYVQSFEGTSTGGNYFIFRQAGVHWEPLPLFASIGALNQSTYHNSLMFDDEPSFPAARAGLRFQPQAWTLEGLGEAAIPTTTSYGTFAKELEPTPSKQSAFLVAKWEPHKYLYFTSNLGYFSYNNLPTGLATESAFGGNTVEKITDSDYRFANNYRGYEASAKLYGPLFKRLNGYLTGEYVQNIEAPAEAGLAYSAGAGLEFLMSGRKSLEMSGKYYRIESDAILSYYTSLEYKQSNRNGYIGDVRMHFNKEGFTAGALYMESEVIYRRLEQSRDRFIYLIFIKHYGKS